MPNVTETTDAANSTATTYTLGIGQTATGQLSVGDSDYYRVHLVAGQTYTFAEVGEGALNQNVDDTYLNIRNSSNAIVAFSDDDGPGLYSTVTYTATVTGDYFIDAGSFQLAGSGRYGVSVTAGTHASYDELMGAAAILTPGASWAATPGTAVNVTWGVRDSFAGSTDASNNVAPFSQLTPSEIATVQSVLAFYSSVCGLTFTQVNPGGTTDNATMLFSNYTSTTDGAGAYALYPTTTAPDDSGGDVRLNTNSVDTASQPVGSYSYLTILHETGHAVGLSHPGDYNAAPGVPITYDNNAQFIQDSNQYTVMSYFDETNTGASEYNDYPDTLMLNDIVALQQLYGANMTTRTGNTVYGFGSNAGAIYNFALNTDPALCIWDAGGLDTLNASGFSQVQVIRLGAGQFSDIGGFHGNISIAYGATIENAIGGSGADQIYGNSAANTLNGGGGADTMRGLGGNDNYVVDNAGDIVDESIAGSSGTDGVFSSAISINLSDAVHFKGSIENAALSGSANLNLIGSGLANTLVGNAGNNVLNGAAGADYMRGLGGNDSYIVDNLNDIVDEGIAGSGGTDAVYSSVISINLANTAHFKGSIENAVLQGAANLNLTGNGIANTLVGNSGNNTLNGGAGADYMRGGAGNDNYIVDNAGDIADESIAGSGGADAIYSSAISINLGDTAHYRGSIENAVLQGASNLNLTGNSLNNILIGNSGGNVFDGRLGGDTMTGNAGNDVFRFDTALGGGNVDRITDYTVANDQFQIDNAIFTGLANGALAVAAFFTGAAAHDVDDRIIYNSATGALFFDSDGTGATAQIQFATLSAGLALAAAEFAVI